MSDNRVRIQTQVELSSAPGSIIKTSGANEPQYLPPGTNGQVLTITGGTPVWATPVTGSSFSITDGTTTQVISSGDTLTFAAGNGASVAVSAPDTLTVSARRSTDAGNAVVFGTDGGLYVPQANLVTDADWDDATNTLTITFANGSTVDVPIVDAIGTFLSDWSVQGDSGSYTVDNHSVLSIIGTPGQIVTDVTAGQVQISLGYSEAKQNFLGLTSGNTVTLSSTPLAGSLIQVFRNGLLLIEGVGNEFTVSGTTITFATSFGSSSGGAGGEDVVVFYKVG